MLSVNVVIHPWDLETLGLEQALDTLSGELGATGVVVPVVSAPARVLRYDGHGRLGVEVNGGGCWFVPQAERYSATRLKSPAVERVKQYRFLDRVHEAAEQRNLDVHVRLSAGRVGRLAQRHPEAAATDLLGYRSEQRLCLLHGDVAELLRALGREVVERFQPCVIEWDHALELDLDPADEPVEGLVFQPPLVSFLRRQCCCESCQRLALDVGIDVRAALKSMLEAVEMMLVSGVTAVPPVEAWLDAHPVVRAWMDTRANVRSRRLRSLAVGSGVGTEFLVPIGLSRDLGIPWPMPGEDVPGDHTSIRLTCWGDLHVESVLDRLVLSGHQTQGVKIEIPAFDPRHPDGSWLVNTLHSLVEAGAESVNLDHYGGLPPKHRNTLRQAIRYARRT